MIGTIKIKERGSTPRRMAKKVRAWIKEAWFVVGKTFHADYRERRFTPIHAAAARYTKRKGQNLPHGSKRWKRSYYGRKFISPFGGGRNRADPLVYTGRTKRLMRNATVSSTSKGARVRYPGARVLNFKHPKSQVRGFIEFRRILDSEAKELAAVHDDHFDGLMAADSATSTERVYP